MLHIWIAQHRFVWTFKRPRVCWLCWGLDTILCILAPLGACLSRETQSHPLWHETRKHSLRWSSPLIAQSGWLRIRLLRKSASLHIRPVTILQSPRGHFAHSLLRKSRYLVTWLHLGWALHWRTTIPREQRAGVTWVYYGTAGHFSWENDR